MATQKHMMQYHVDVGSVVALAHGVASLHLRQNKHLFLCVSGSPIFVQVAVTKCIAQ